MPDSFLPPAWGTPPFDDWDLDALLSGEAADIPVALRQVAEALTALRAAPTFAELRGEATIMAEFRALAEFRAFGLREASGPGGLARTLELPVAPSALAPRPAARHRGRRRRTARLLSRPAAVVMGAAAAAVIVAAVTLAVVDMPGHDHHLVLSSATSSAGAHPSSHGSTSPNLAARGATPAPTPTPTPTPGPSPKQSTARRLCTEYYGNFVHPQPQSEWYAEFAIFQQLSERAGSPYRVLSYCKPYIASLFPHGYPWASQQQRAYQAAAGNAGQGNQGQGASTGAPQPSPGASGSSGQGNQGGQPGSHP
ncbi:hypothetical protein [Trebonia sp.]|uniref:hypothetical protein n=1 Tax=Trebonia sp. TaxID=2767075 RepID=UPI0026358A63|nr:hypothetical protein [Trebonia sp.]